jgi:large subunit ribosomal protein L3
MSLGLIGRKLGMTQVYTSAGELVPVTVVQAGPCTIVQTKNAATDGYAAAQIGFGEKKPQRASKPYRQHCRKVGDVVFQVLREFRLAEPDESLAAGQQISVANLFKQGDLVDVTGTSKGRGYSGVVKRHRFSGFPASHGTHEYFRHGGSIGNRSFPGRVFKGKRMAGQFGNVRVTTQNIRVLEVRPEENLLLLCGAVPGATGGMVIVRPAVKAARHG